MYYHHVITPCWGKWYLIALFTCVVEWLTVAELGGNKCFFVFADIIFNLVKLKSTYTAVLALVLKIHISRYYEVILCS